MKLPNTRTAFCSSVSQEWRARRCSAQRGEDGSQSKHQGLLARKSKENLTVTDESQGCHSRIHQDQHVLG